MSIQIKWDNPEHDIIYIEFDGKWTWKEFFASIEESKTLAQTVPHRVDFITNFKGTSIPRDGSALSNGKSFMRNRAPNAGAIICVTNAFMTVMLNTFKSFDKELGGNLYAVTSTEEAHRLVKALRAKA
jgi:hypothetical protein